MLRRIFVLVVTLAMALGHGGMAEAIENALHLTVSGHTAHDTENADEHTHEDLEHGCVGEFHACACCAHQPLLLTEVRLEIVSLMASLEIVSTFFVVDGPAGAPVRVFRPPIV